MATLVSVHLGLGVKIVDVPAAALAIVPAVALPYLAMDAQAPMIVAVVTAELGFQQGAFVVMNSTGTCRSQTLWRKCISFSFLREASILSGCPRTWETPRRSRR